MGATFGDFSDQALLSVLTTGQPLGEVQSWLAYIKPDAAKSVAGTSKNLLKAFLKEGAETFKGKSTRRRRLVPRCALWNRFLTSESTLHAFKT